MIIDSSFQNSDRRGDIETEVRYNFKLRVVKLRAEAVSSVEITVVMK